ncbi:MAG: tripartite tricarboxylate transporter TctB family protein [Johnsonella sp.]|nr:tripartite tricarboxylate transporter TctB family protein [Johnsonella sp.]
MQAKKLSYNYEMISGGIFALLAALMWVLTPGQIQTLEKSAINARTVPQIAIAGLFIFSTALFIQGLRRPKKVLVLDKSLWESPNFKKEMRTLIFALMLLVYGILFNIIGYIADTILLVVGILFYYRCKKWLYYAIAVVTVFIVYAVFTYMLNVNLPGLF